MAAVFVAVHFGIGMSIWQAAITGIVSWAAIQLFRRSLGRPIYALGGWVERRAAGSRLDYSVDDVVQGKLHREQYSRHWNAWKQAQLAERNALPAPRTAGQPRHAPSESDVSDG